MDLAALIALLQRSLWGGWTGVLDYLAAHVLLCLLPAFIIAGFMSAMIPKEVVTRYLGTNAPRWISYPAAAAGGFLLAVCSCTILPLFAGIWKRGAGLGAAVTFLFVGPAVNILAIAYTGAAIGADIALARIVGAIVFGVLIGMLMAWIFRTQEQSRLKALEQGSPFNGKAGVQPELWLLFMLLLAVLVVGTLQVKVLTSVWFDVRLPIEIPVGLRSTLGSLGLDVQGALLIALLLVLAPAAYLGFDRVLERRNRWTAFSVGLVALTLLIATPVVEEGSLTLGFGGRAVAETLLLVAIGVLVWRRVEKPKLADWMWETWRFVKQIAPLLLIGVFSAGMLRELIPETWVQSLAGRNTLLANFVGVVFGVFMYFPTLVEVPMARMFLDLGMHRGPLLAYLLADPELSLQSILVTGRILGRVQTVVYVSLVAIFSTLAGYVFGWVLAT